MQRNILRSNKAWMIAADGQRKLGLNHHDEQRWALTEQAEQAWALQRVAGLIRVQIPTHFSLFSSCPPHNLYKLKIAALVNPDQPLQSSLSHDHCKVRTCLKALPEQGIYPNQESSYFGRETVLHPQQLEIVLKHTNKISI